MPESWRETIARLEARVAELEAATCVRPADRSDQQDPRTPLTRRRLLTTGGLAAVGATGLAVGSAAPAGAQEPVTADSVTFTPTGDVSATNVQAAIAEVDIEKAPLAGATFTGSVTAARAQFKELPFVDVRAYDAKGDGVSDDTLAIRAAVATAKSLGGGTVFLPPGRYRFSDKISIPEGVDIRGGGGHLQGRATSGTVLIATNGNARLVITGEGGISGNFLVAGDQVNGEKVADPTKGLVYIDAVERTFECLRVSRSKTDGLVVEGTQNCAFVQLLVGHCDGNGLVLDLGAGGNSFLRCEVTGCGDDNVLIQQTGTSRPGTHLKPRNNLFLHCIIERGPWQNGGWNGPNHSQLHVTAGEENKFIGCAFWLSETNTSTSGYVVVLGDGVVLFDNCRFGGGGIHNGILATAGAHFTGITHFQQCPTAVTWNDGAWGEVIGTFRYQAVTTKWDGSGSWQNKSVHTSLPPYAQIHPDAAFGFQSAVEGENGYRFRVSRDGAVHLSDGTTYQPKATWQLGGDGTGWETPNDVHLNGGSLAMQEIGATPAGIPAGNQAVMYVKNDKLVVAFNESGTTRYRYLPLTGTSAAWVHTTTPP